jgi:hypothetical protein
MRRWAASNCLIFAVLLWLRWGGYLVMRRSHWGWFPHFLHGRAGRDGRLRLVGYVPRSPRRKILPPPLFRGRVRWGD